MQALLHEALKFSARQPERISASSAIRFSASASRTRGTSVCLHRKNEQFFCRPAFGKPRSRNNSVPPRRDPAAGLLPEAAHPPSRNPPLLPAGHRKSGVRFLSSVTTFYHAGTGCKDCPGTQNSGSAHGTGTGKYQHLSEGSLISHRRAGKKPVQIFFFH